jgi:hypothetical protein
MIDVQKEVEVCKTYLVLRNFQSSTVKMYSRTLSIFPNFCNERFCGNYTFNRAKSKPKPRFIFKTSNEHKLNMNFKDINSEFYQNALRSHLKFPILLIK